MIWEDTHGKPTQEGRESIRIVPYPLGCPGTPDCWGGLREATWRAEGFRPSFPCPGCPVSLSSPSVLFPWFPTSVHSSYLLSVVGIILPDFHPSSYPSPPKVPLPFIYERFYESHSKLFYDRVL
jgi:hypothetical protein